MATDRHRNPRKPMDGVWGVVVEAPIFEVKIAAEGISPGQLPCGGCGGVDFVGGAPVAEGTVGGRFF